MYKLSPACNEKWLRESLIQWQSRTITLFTAFPGSASNNAFEDYIKWVIKHALRNTKMNGRIRRRRTGDKQRGPRRWSLCEASHCEIIAEASPQQSSSKLRRESEMFIRRERGNLIGRLKLMQTLCPPCSTSSPGLIHHHQHRRRRQRRWFAPRNEYL